MVLKLRHLQRQMCFFIKPIELKPIHCEEGVCSLAEVSFITDRSMPNVSRLYQMTVWYVKCSKMSLI